MPWMYCQKTRIWEGQSQREPSAERERTNLFDAKCFDTLDGWSRLLNNCSRHTSSITS
jgi:hypothetical protein